MNVRHQGRAPIVDPSARVAPNATLCGDVTVGPGVSIGFGAVIVAESGPVRIGAQTVVMDGAILRGLARDPLTIGEAVMVGPGAYLSGCTVDDEAYLAARATVFNGARIGRGAQVRINGLVHLRTVLPPAAMVPINWIAVGDPARILPDQHEAIWEVQRTLNFPGYVFGVKPEARPTPIGEVMRDLMGRYGTALVRGHAEDTVEADAPTSGA